MRRDDNLRRALIAIAFLTILSGLLQVVAPGPMLRRLAGGSTPATRHLFGTIGMFMIMFGGASAHALLDRDHGDHDHVVLLWAGLQKFGAAGAVAIGVARGVFSPLALLVAGFDLLSGGLMALYRRACAERRDGDAITPFAAPVG